MNLRTVAFALLAVLIALAWGAKEWLADIWNGLKVDTQIKIAVGGFTLGMVILIHIFKPWIVQYFM